MHVDLLAMQEIMQTAAAQTAMQTLRAELDRLTSGAWQSDLQACAAPSDQHVGYLWNTQRITPTRQADARELNGAATLPDGSARQEHGRRRRLPHPRGAPR
jgi:hypothetical protein